jgi:hypothetical protein
VEFDQNVSASIPVEENMDELIDDMIIDHKIFNQHEETIKKATAPSDMELEVRPVNMHTHIHSCITIHIYVCIYLYINTYIYKYLYVYRYRYTHIYIYTYIYRGGVFRALWRGYQRRFLRF